MLENSRGVPTAEEFIFKSLRGAYLISRAIGYGGLEKTIEKLDKVPSPLREVSDLADYRYIQETIWEFDPQYIRDNLGSISICLGNYHVGCPDDDEPTCECGAIYTSRCIDQGCPCNGSYEDYLTYEEAQKAINKYQDC